jgi:8-oxo-dGTP pyrophosphatase MutT (NUDIX family)/transcriptional regulator with XRE-family HTH domain
MMACVTQGLDINQVIAYNLMRVRKALGLSQEQAAERLAPHLGVRWSKAVYSAAERSYAGKRIRQFTAADVAAFAVAFSVPLLYFFLPPRPDDREATGVVVGDRLVSWADLLDVMLDGKQQSALHLRLFELSTDEWPTALNQLVGLGIGRWTAFPEGGSRSGTWEFAVPSAQRQDDEDEVQQPIVAAIVRSSRGVLVGRRNDGKPPWTFIAGEVEPGEQPEDAAVREVKEETGLEVRAGQVIGERDHPKTGRHMIYMAAEPVRGLDIFVGDEDELAEVRWVSLAEADELLPGMFEPVREHLARELGGAE